MPPPLRTNDLVADTRLDATIFPNGSSIKEIYVPTELADERPQSVEEI